MKQALILSVVLAAVACDKKKDESSDTAGAQTPKVPVSGGQQVIPDPAAGDKDDVDVVDDDDDKGDEDVEPAPPYSDFRPDAGTTYSLPTQFSSVDPRNYVPSGTFQQGRGKIDLSFSDSNILVPSDGWMREHAACATPIAAPGHAAVNVTVDASLGEWPASSIIAIDRAGDGAAGSATRDVVAVRWAQSATYYHMAFEMAGNWPSDSFIRIDISKLLIPADDTTTPNVGYAAADRLWTLVQNNQLYVYDDNVSNYVAKTPGTGMGQVDYAIATSGKFVEIKLPRSLIDPLMDGQPFAVQMNTEFGSDPIRDYVGTHLVGLTDDYACLVPIPNETGVFDSHKMVVMRRAAGVSASDAENVYRSLIAAMPEATMNTKDDYDRVDTFSMSVITEMAAAGVCGPQIGIVMIHNINDRFGAVRQPYMNFYVAAHEYLHNFNAQDYALPASWGVEGHSDWMSSKTMTSYYGRWAGQTKFSKSARSFRQEEATHATVQPIDTNSWSDAPFSALFYYDKSSTYWDILSTKLEYGDLLDNFYRNAQTSSAFADSDAMIAGLKGLASYTLQPTDDIESGWFGGNYNDSILPLTLTDDTDNDGLMNYQETAFGTDSTKADSDNDGLSDSFEWAVGLNPLVSAPRNQLALDQMLGDWDRAAPGEMKTAVTNLGVCSAQLKRYGLVQSQGWLFFGAELTANVAANERAYLVFDIYEPGETAIQMVVGSGNDFMRPAYIDGTEPNKYRPLDLGIAPFGGKSYEVAYNLAWLGWDKVPSGTDVNVRMLVYNVTGNSWQHCDRADDIAISEL
jgi:hypothetical protein